MKPDIMIDIKKASQIHVQAKLQANDTDYNPILPPPPKKKFIVPV
jgi:hypothetical protein